MNNKCPRCGGDLDTIVGMPGEKLFIRCKTCLRSKLEAAYVDFKPILDGFFEDDEKPNEMD